MTQQVIFENEITNLCFNILKEYEPSLKLLGVTSIIKDIRRTGIDATYQSEMAVYFCDERGMVGLFDVIEFFIYKNGKPTASKKEFELWFRATLMDVIDKRKHDV